MLQMGYIAVKLLITISVDSVILNVVTLSRRSVRDMTATSVAERPLIVAACGGLATTS